MANDIWITFQIVMLTLSFIAALRLWLWFGFEPRDETLNLQRHIQFAGSGAESAEYGETGTAGGFATDSGFWEGFDV